MPKKAAITPTEIITALQTYKTDIEKNLNHSSAEIWKVISNLLNGLISPKALYTFVKSNKYHCLNKLDINENLLDHKRYYTYSSSDNSEKNFEQFVIDFAIDKKKWEQIGFITKRYRDGKIKTRLNKGWTDIFMDSFIHTTKSKCTWSLKNHIIKNEQNISITGYCRICDSSLRASSFYNSEDKENIYFKCFLSSLECIINNKNKRQLRGIKRLEVGDELAQGKLAINWRRENARKLINFGDPEPCNLYTLDVLRKCRQEAMMRKMDYFPPSKCPINSLLVLKYTLPYSSIIKNLGLDKFFMHYWTKDQIVIYENYCKEKSITTVSIDATGSLVKKIDRPYDNVSGHIFLYTGVIHLGRQSGQIPIMQMLSEAHDSNSISYWLKCWINSGIPLPKIIICDHSLALMNAVTTAFANCTLKSYISQCIKNLQDHNSSIPNFQLRIDYAHVVKLITRWKSFQNKPRLFKDFYVRSMVILIKEDNFVNAMKIIEALFIVCNSEYSGEVGGKKIETPCKISKNFLKALISGLETIIIEEDMSNSDSVEYNTNKFDLDYTSSWIENVKSKVLEKCNFVTDTENYHYCSDFSKDLERFLKTYPLWSSIMTRKFGYGKQTESSAIVESYFNELKTREMNDLNLPIRVDKFFKLHVDSIESMLKLAATEKEDVTQGTYE